MNKEPHHDTDHQEGAKILQFRQPEPTELAKAILRHPACGHETIEETLKRLGLDDSDLEDSSD